MYKRHLENKIKDASLKYKAIALVGPRQSGKTTLAKICFPNFSYISLENPNQLKYATEDPISFLESITKDVILDEIQNTPELLSYLQEIIDNTNDTRKFILTGSNSFLLNKKISQSLAGRVHIFTILPLTYSELTTDNFSKQLTIDNLMWQGFYPKIHQEKLPAQEWLANYYQTYVQKDLRATLNIKNLSLFDNFIRISASRVGQLANFLNIGNEVGISQPTATEWMSVLENSYIIFRLQPHFKNFSKQIIKSPKIFFYDTGLLCYLLRINTFEQLLLHPLRGQIFENYIISEILKEKLARSEDLNIFFWRDTAGHEIDIVIDKSTSLLPIEIKSGKTFSSDWIKNLDWINKLQNASKSYLIYGGEDSFNYKNTAVLSWKNIAPIL